MTYIISAGPIGWISLLFTHYIQGLITPLAHLTAVKQSLIPDMPSRHDNKMGYF